MLSAALRERRKSSPSRLNDMHKLKHISEEQINPFCDIEEEKENITDMSGKRNDISECKSNSQHISKNKSSDNFFETSAKSCIEPNLSTTSADNVTKEIANLRSEMQERFRKLEFEVQLSGETLKYQSYTTNFNFFYQQMNILEEMRDGMAMLLHTDAYRNEFSRLQQENEMLKSKIRKMREEK